VPGITIFVTECVVASIDTVSSSRPYETSGEQATSPSCEWPISCPGAVQHAQGWRYSATGSHTGAIRSPASTLRTSGAESFSDAVTVPL
jgi:hypothetical protein